MLIAKGIEIFEDAGADSVNAFRAGSFGMNRDTLEAVAANGLTFDSSYHSCLMGPTSEVADNEYLFQPKELYGVTDTPHDGFRRLSRTF